MLNSYEKLIKLSDGTASKPRTQAGGWSYVEQLPDWIELQRSALHEKVEEDLAVLVAKSCNDDPEKRAERLKVAPKRPEKVQTTSVSYLRNPDAIAEVLKRANGKCEDCRQDAPFIRRKDNTPYLEVHHKKRLADDGEDSVENAMALCPNCHRKAHYG
ncbi:HNH endonuclease [Endozoicomonas sp. SCSIO W0465]|uniref:HNH endonuclease n=1 Tax=Endozoicomonas sp. SCSIO W0465 TaxID=2918516 RepID=UPI00207581FD|nr:HNH endonuclease [Endozoicomonas sp. SCSIO W0465]USE35009.1 HNH endonuclease [Endozoicomonas sp. SCSIO W0465]